MRCPACGGAVEPDKTPRMPFCSERCTRIDLGRWLKEEHGVPYESEDEPQGLKCEDP